MSRKRIGAAVGLLLIVVAARIESGSLTPPPGVLAPTMKTLDEVKPGTPITGVLQPDGTYLIGGYTISQPGHYYLATNLVGTSGQPGIIISTNQVTLDLQGLRLFGGPGTEDAIISAGLFNGIVIQNGTISNWGGIGANLSQAKSSRFSNATFRQNNGGGLWTGNEAVVDICTFINNDSHGVVAGLNTVVTHSTASYNGGSGIYGAEGVNITHSTANNNNQHGIVIGHGGLVSSCTASFNQQNGIFAQDAGSVLNSIASSNQVHGIAATSGSLNRGNNSFENGNNSTGAGIYAIGGMNRIEDNHVTGNDWGVKVAAGGNFISKNTAIGNTTLNFDIVAGNRFSTPVTSANIDTANAWANFSF